MGEIKLSDQAIEASKSVVWNHFGQNKSLGIVINNCFGNDLYTNTILSINDYLKDNYKLDVSIFAINKSPSQIPATRCSVFDINELNVFYGDLIVTDIESYFAVPQHIKKYFYIYDPMRLTHVKKEVLQQIINDPTVKFTRNALYEQTLNQQFGIKTIHKYVPYTEIPKILEIINKE